AIAAIAPVPAVTAPGSGVPAEGPVVAPDSADGPVAGQQGPVAEGPPGAAEGGVAEAPVDAHGPDVAEAPVDSRRPGAGEAAVEPRRPGVAEAAEAVVARARPQRSTGDRRARSDPGSGRHPTDPGPVRREAAGPAQIRRAPRSRRHGRR